MNKVYLHIDLDAFFASVEQLDNPSLKGKPVIVGGKPGDRRSVVSTCSYEARRFGVHSAMSIFQAVKLCPDGVYIHPRMKRYQQKSLEVMSIFHEYSPDVQQLSVDEAFVDLTGTEKLFGPPEETARKIKREVMEKTGLTVSVGLASTKYCAKIASGLNKPDGFFAVPFGKEEDFMLSLPLEKLWGAGNKTLEKLHSSGIKTMKDLHSRSENLLQSLFGNATGTFLYNAVRGKEYEDFNSKPKTRSISAETTFEYDLTSPDSIETALLELCDTVMFRSLKEKKRGKSVALKIRYEDFSTVSIQDTKERYVSSVDDLFERIKLLFKKKYTGNLGIRLFGVAIQNLEDDTKPRAEELFDFGEEKKRKVESAILKAEEKNPSVKIIKARLLSKSIILPLFFLALSSSTFSQSDSQEIFREEEVITQLKTHSAKESISDSDGAGSIIFDTSSLPLETSGEAKTIFERDLFGKNVDFLAEGYWKSSVEANASYSFGFGSDSSYSLSTPAFVQNVDLSLWIMYDNHWYFEAAFADGFEKNTVGAGYSGDGILKSARIANRNIIFPDIYSVNDLGRGIGGGENQSPGISFSWKGSRWQADLAVRYDFLESHEKTWYGKNSVTDTFIELSQYNTGNQYVLPSSKLLQDIKDVYVESYAGTYTDSSGRKYRKLNDSQYLLISASNTLLLSKDAKAYRSNGSLPCVALTFHSGVSQSDLGSYSDKDTFLGKVQEWFGDTVSLSKYTMQFFGKIESEEVLFIQSSSGFSPFVNASRYDLGLSSAGDADVASKSSGTIFSDYTAIIADADIDFTLSDFFYTNHTYADISAASSSSKNASDASARFPLAKKDPYIYLSLQKDDDMALRVRSYSPVSRLEIGTDAVNGTIQVYKNNVLDSAAKYDSESGTITLSTGISGGDHIYVTWSTESEDKASGSIAGSMGFKYDFTKKLSADFSLASRWSLEKQRKYADSDYATSGYASAATSISYSGENFSLKNTAGITLQNDNTTGTFRLLGMDDCVSETNYLSKEAGIPLPADFTPSLNERRKNPLEIYPDLIKNKNDALSSMDGLSDSGISGYAIPLSWDFTQSHASQEYSWAAMTIDISSAKSELYSASVFSIALKNFNPAVSDFDLYLQLGVSTEDDFKYENKERIPTWKISDSSGSDVENFFDASSPSWQIVSVSLSDLDRSFLNLSGNYGARLIALPKNNSVTSINKTGTVLAGPYEVEKISFSVTSSEKLHVSSYQKADPLLYSSKIKSLNKDTDGKSTTNYVQTFSWKSIESSTQTEEIKMTKYFEEIDISKYKRLSFWLKFDSSSDSKITFSLSRPSSTQADNEENALSFTVSSQDLDSFWQKFVLDLDKKTVEFSGKKSKISVDDSVIPTCLKIKIEAENLSQNDWGELSIDELYFSKNSPYIILQDTLSSSWKKDGDVLAFNDFSILKDVDISGKANGERYLNIDGSNQKGEISSSAKIAMTLTNIKIKLEGTKDTSSKTKNPLGSASHYFETENPILNVLSLKEEYSFNEIENTLEKNNAATISLNSIHIPLKISSDFSSLADDSSRNQKMNASLSFSPGNFSFVSKAHANQKILSSSQTEKIEAERYFSSWKEISRFEFSSGDKNASKREIYSSSSAAYSLSFLNLKPSVSYTIKGNYKNSSSSTFTDFSNITMSLPFSVNKNSFELSWKKSAGSVRQKEAGGKYKSDMADLRRGMKSEKWFYASMPFYDLASTSLTKKVSKTPYKAEETENSLEESSEKDLISSASYSCEYAFNWKRPFFGNRYDFFVPGGNTLSFSRDILSSQSTSDIYQLKDTVRYSAMNIFGSRGSIPLLKFFEQDEYTSSLSLAVKIPKNDPKDKTFYCTGYFQSVFYMNDTDSVSSAVEGTFQAKNDFLAKYSLIWKRNSNFSVSAALVKLAVKKFSLALTDEKNLPITKTDSINLKASISSSTNGVTKKYSAQYAHQTDSQISRYVTINSSIGLGYESTWNESVTITAAASLGVTVKF